jgi:segregation and condensation protein A
MGHHPSLDNLNYQMTFHVQTTVFEGPLDLLLQLITRHQLEITSIGLTQVVEEYLSVIVEMQELDLEVTSEFLLIAATLIQIKAQALLPSSSEIDLDDELALVEERDRLLSRLLASVTFKDVAAVLRRRLQDGARFVPRTSGIDQRIPPPNPHFDLPVDLDGLRDIGVRVFARATLEPDLDHLDLDLPSVEEAIGDLKERLTAETVSSFDSLTEHCSRTVEVAAYFLALLELARWGLIELSQRDWTAPIEVRSRDGGTIDLSSEWA